MEINRQLFEDVLSGKLKGTFVLRNGITVNSNRLIPTSYQAYAFEGMSYIFDRNGETTVLGCSIIDFIPEINMKNELSIEIPYGKTVDWEESKKRNKIVFKDKQLTYKDICEKMFSKLDTYYYVNNHGNISAASSICNPYIINPNSSSTEHQLECILAKNKLANVAKYLNDGWKPNKGTLAFTITCYGDFNNYPIVSDYYFGKSNGENLVLFRTYDSAHQAIEILGEETVKLALEPLGI